MKLLIHWLVSAAALLLTAYVLPGFHVGNFPSALIIAVVIGFVNILIRPILLLLTLPLNILTLGLFTLVVNGMVIKISAAILSSNFIVESWTAAILGALLVSFFSLVMRLIFGIQKD